VLSGCYQSSSGNGDVGYDPHEVIHDPATDEFHQDFIHDPTPEHGDPMPDPVEPWPDLPPDLPPLCGNGVVENLEECDDGANGDDEDGCTDSCLFTCLEDRDCENYEMCDGRETCDLAAHMCSQGIPQPDGTVCLADPRSICIAQVCQMSTCGDGFVDMDEECDDGNVIDGDACTNACRWNTCGNGLCDGNDDCVTCPDDCGACPSMCGTGNLWRSSIYWFCPTDADWNAAENNCGALFGGHLVVIDDSSEQEFVLEAAQTVEPSRTWWIGLTDVENEGEWLTVTGASAPFQYWGSGEPNNSHGGDCISGVSEEDCVELDASNVGGGWNDYPCACVRPWFICELGP
jgi:cysteine-rich repeat protein